MIAAIYIHTIVGFQLRLHLSYLSHLLLVAAVAAALLCVAAVLATFACRKASGLLLYIALAPSFSSPYTVIGAVSGFTDILVSCSLWAIFSSRLTDLISVACCQLFDSQQNKLSVFDICAYFSLSLSRMQCTHSHRLHSIDLKNAH